MLDLCLCITVGLAATPRCSPPQTPAATQPSDRVEHVVTLKPGAEGDPARPRWSPKGATVLLNLTGDDAMTGTFPLGAEGAAPVTVRLSRNPDSPRFDRLWIDLDRDGDTRASELLSCTPSERRGKWWSSWEAVVPLPVPATHDDEAATRPYPMALWYVEDPAEPDAPPALRWSRRGWHVGTVQIGGADAFVLLSEMEMDGVFDQRDAWAIARNREDLAKAPVRTGEQHCWLDGAAWRPTAIDAHGRSLTIAPFDPGITQAEEEAKADVYRADREEPRAAKPIAFGNDLAAALAQAKREHKRVLVDFETTWCGPCKQMNRLVYPAAAVVDAAAGLLAVKLDGDEQKELVKRYGVAAYPTVLVLDADGEVLRRAVGYQSVAAMVKLLAP